MYYLLLILCIADYCYGLQAPKVTKTAFKQATWLQQASQDNSGTLYAVKLERNNTQEYSAYLLDARQIRRKCLNAETIFNNLHALYMEQLSEQKKL